MYLFIDEAGVEILKSWSKEANLPYWDDMKRLGGAFDKRLGVGIPEGYSSLNVEMAKMWDELMRSNDRTNENSEKMEDRFEKIKQLDERMYSNRVIIQNEITREAKASKDAEKIGALKKVVGKLAAIQIIVVMYACLMRGAIEKRREIEAREKRKIYDEERPRESPGGFTLPRVVVS